MRMSQPARWAMVGVLGGIVVGAVLTALYHERHATALFSPRARRRWAALGRLTTEAAVDSIPLVREYVAWETHPRLRERGRALLRRLQSLHG
jgi:hypothetical protein